MNDIREDHGREQASLRAADLFRDAHDILFTRGVQMRLTLAILVSILFVFLPLILYSLLLAIGGAESYDPESATMLEVLRYVLSAIGGIVLLIGGELFVALPMLLSLPLMAEKAVRGEEIAVSDVFSVFSRQHYRTSLFTLLSAAVLNALPISLCLSTVYGATTIYAVVRLNPSTEPFLPHVAVFCSVVCLVALAVAVFLSIPGYYFLSFRVRRRESGEKGRRSAVLTSYTVLRGGFTEYLRLRGRFLVLHAASLLTVAALYPIYTIPMYLIVTALSASRMDASTEEQ